MKLLYSNPSSELVESVNRVIQASKSGQRVELLTSGTTGQPKRFDVDTVGALQKKTGGNGADVWLLTYLPSRWAGISVILHCLKFNSTLVLPDSMSVTGVYNALISNPVTHLSLTPSMFRNILISDSSNSLKAVPLKQITFGGEYAKQSVLDLAASFWPEARVSHVYASSEHGDICSVSDKIEGFPVSKFSKFEIKDQELFIDGKTTGDLWELKGERYCFIGRRVEQFNVGGNKVSPLIIEEAAIKSGALAARSYTIPNPILGSLIGLDYVGAIESIELQRKLCDLLPKFARPSLVKQVETIELSETGKIRRLQ